MSRLIDADKLYEAVMKKDIKLFDNQDIDVFLDAIEDQPTVNEWILVSERLPDNSGYYLVTGKYREEERKYWICECMNMFGLLGWRNSANNPSVEAWMPIPTYKEDE